MYLQDPKENTRFTQVSETTETDLQVIMNVLRLATDDHIHTATQGRI